MNKRPFCNTKRSQLLLCNVKLFSSTLYYIVECIKGNYTCSFHFLLLLFALYQTNNAGRGKSSQKAIKMVRGYSYTLAIIPKFSTEFVDRNKNLLHRLGFIKCPYFLKLNMSNNFQTKIAVREWRFPRWLFGMIWIDFAIYQVNKSWKITKMNGEFLFTPLELSSNICWLGLV